MACRYEYMGRVFENELALNDFLIAKSDYLTSDGDIVFSLSRSDRCLHSRNILLRATEEANEAAEAKRLWADANRIYTEDGVDFKLPPPYEGVNAFLSGRRNSEGNLMFPEFIEENYWKERFKKWAVGDYTSGEGKINEAEIDEFGIDLNLPTVVPLHSNFAKYERGEIPFEQAITPEQKRMKEAMEQRWKAQATFGDVIHAIGEKYFGTIKSGAQKGKPWYEVLDENPNLFMQQIQRIKNINLLSDDQVTQAITYFKKLKETLQRDYGEDVHFIPELAVLGTLNNPEGGVDKLMGRIDLAVITGEGKVHIVDYKTSPKNFQDYPTAKQLAFKYQLATYQRLLAQKGISKHDSEMIVAPIQMSGFRKTGSGYVFESVKSDAISRNLTTEIKSENIQNNLDEFLKIPTRLTADSEELLQSVSSDMAKLFPEYGKSKTDEEVRQMLERAGAFQRSNDSLRPYVYKPKWDSRFQVEAGSPEELFTKVKEGFERAKERSVDMTMNIKNLLAQGIRENTSDLDFPRSSESRNSQWIRNVLAKYCNDNWEIMEGEPAYEALLNLGMILLKNKNTEHIEVVKISNRYLKYNAEEGGNKNITAHFEPDIIESRDSASNILEGATGNIELIEAMLAINNLHFNQEVNIGRIAVLNPRQAMGITASNEQLLYSFNKLHKLGKLSSENQYEGSNLRLATKAQVALLSFQDILSRVDNTHSRTADTLRGYKSSVSALDGYLAASNKTEVLAELHKLRRSLESDFDMRNVTTVLDKGDQRDIYEVYSQVMLAIAELNGRSYKQQLQDHDKWSLNPKAILSGGFYSNQFENPGNYSSNILNVASQVAHEAYQSVRDEQHRAFRTISKLIEELKQEQGYGKFKEYTYGNQTELYRGMIEKRDDDLMFVNPWDPTCTLSEKQKKFLKHAIIEINKQRFEKTESDIEGLAMQGDYDILKVPLIQGTDAARIASEGWGETLKNRFKRMFQASYWKDQVSDFLTEQDERTYRASEVLFEMNNTMDAGNGPRRKDILQACWEKNPQFFETDVERILMHHSMAYSIQKNMEERMPIIKAASIALSTMAEFQNTEYKADLKTIEDFVRNKIKKESLVNENLKTIAGATKGIQQVASFMALGFAPVQMTYQSLEGIWKAIKLSITKPDGTDAFSKQHFIDAYKLVLKDLGHFSEKPTLMTAVNQVYGINDMDINSYAENLANDKHGIFHFFNRYAFKMTSRPDFYNRMTIFAAQMMEDGCLDAHSQDADGRLIYNWKKDKRYEAFANEDRSDMKKYNEAKARYITVARQFVQEGARNAYGTLFEFDINKKNALPRAYTSQEAESKKDFADSLYGYYDHTKRSLWQSTFVGSLIGQMRTYWSAKKNQYFQPGGVKIKGRYEQLKDEEGNPMFYRLKADGSIDLDAPPTKEDTGIPFYRWQGDWQEGILVTLYGITKDLWNHRDEGVDGMKDTFYNNWWNHKDERMRRAYRANLLSGAYDIAMLIVVGGTAALIKSMYDDMEKEAIKTESLGDALAANSMWLLYKTVYNSSLDFNWVDAILSPTIDWNPFAFSYIKNGAENIGDLLTGDKNLFTALGNGFGAARQNKPLFKYLAQHTSLQDD